MKKIAVLFVMLAVLAGTAMAMGGLENMLLGHPIHEELYQADDGLYAGGIAGAPVLSEFDMAGLYLIPYVGYKMEVIENLTVGGEFQLPIMFIGADDMETAILANLNLGARYSVEAGSGNLFFGLDLPMNLFFTMDGESEAFNTIGMDFIVGFKTETFGVDLKIPNYVYVRDGDASFFEGMMFLTGWYNMDAVTFAATLNLPFLIDDAFDAYGIGIVPQVAYALNDNMTIMGALPIHGIGGDMDIEFGLFAGLTYKF